MQICISKNTFCTLLCVATKAEKKMPFLNYSGLRKSLHHGEEEEEEAGGERTDGQCSPPSEFQHSRLFAMNERNGTERSVNSARLAQVDSRGLTGRPSAWVGGRNLFLSPKRISCRISGILATINSCLSVLFPIVPPPAGYDQGDYYEKKLHQRSQPSQVAVTINSYRYSSADKKRM